MKLVSFGGVSLDDGSTQSGIPWDGARDQFRLLYTVSPRPGNTPVVNALAFSERVIPVYLHVPKNVNIPDALDRFQGFLLAQPFKKRVLVAQRPDGTQVQRLAYVSRPNGAMPDGAINGLRVEFVSEEPEWRIVTPAAAPRIPATGGTYDNTATDTWSGGVGFTANGAAPIAPVVTIDTDAPGSGSAPQRYQFTIRNDKDWPLEDMPWLRDLGNTSGWTGSTAANTYLYCDGREIPREVIAIGENRSFVEFTVDLLAPGQTKTYEIVTGGTVAAIPTAPQQLAGRFRAPIPDFGWEVRTMTSSGSTTVVNSAAPNPAMETDRWKDGRIYFLTGPQAGQTNRVYANTGTALTIEAAIGNPYASGARFLLLSSHRDIPINEYILTHAVRETDHDDFPHGLWYQDRAQTRPTDIRYDAPFSWEPIRSFTNDDDVAFKSVSPAVGDYFTTPNISRTYKGGDDNSNLKEKGGGDAVTISYPLPVKKWKLDYRFRNPNGVARAIVAGKQIPDEDWTIYVENATAYDTLTDQAVQDLTLQSGTRHLLFAEWPRLGDEIPASWARDTGGRSGGGYTTLTDDSKDWTPGQWVNARLRITAGKGQGISRTIISNTATTLTWTTPIPSDDLVPNDGSRYEVVNKPLIANLRSHDVWVVTLDTTGIVESALTSLGAAERVAVRVRVGGGSTGTTPHVRLDVGCDTRLLWVAPGQGVKIDCDKQTAWVVDLSTQALIRDVTDWVIPRERGDDLVLMEAEDWFPVLPGANTVYLQRAGGVATHAASLSLPAGWYS